MKGLHRWIRHVVVRQPEMKQQQRFPGRGGFRLLADALLFIEAHAPLWKLDYAPPGVESIGSPAYLPGFSYCPGRALSEVQRELDYMLAWRHPAGSISRWGVVSTDHARLTNLADELHMLFPHLVHRVVEVPELAEVPWSSWDEPVNGTHPLWKLPQVPLGIQVVLGGRWMKHSVPVPTPAGADAQTGELGERSMIL